MERTEKRIAKALLVIGLTQFGRKGLFDILKAILSGEDIIFSGEAWDFNLEQEKLRC